MADFASKSPRSVAQLVNVELSGELPSLKPLSLHEHGRSPIVTLRKMNKVVSVLRTHSLEKRNQNQKRRNSKRRIKRVNFPNEEETDSIEFDQDNSVLSLRNPNLPIPDEDDDDIPWDEQDYEELPWWEYPDLDEDDEVTALCKKVIGCNADARYVDRVEASVWMFAIKLRNLAEFKLHHSKTLEELQKAKQLTKSPPSPKKKRVQIPSIIFGLPQEVHAEKRRYRRHQEQAKKEKESPSTSSGTTTVGNVQKERPSIKEEMKKAAPVNRKIIRRKSCNKATSSSSSTPEKTEGRVCWIRSQAGLNKDLPPVRPNRESEEARQRKIRIQKLKARQQTMKIEQERLEREKAERIESAQRLAAQQKRLDRLLRGKPVDL